jgi:hypothetical protein
MSHCITTVSGQTLGICSRFTVLHNIGFHADLNQTYAVGETDEESQKLIRTTRAALDAAIAMCKPGALFRDIGKVMLVLHAFRFYSSQPSTLVNRSRDRMVVLLFVHIQAMVSTISSMALLIIYPTMLRTKLLEP